jgi:Uma2 family endonuclease
MPTPGIQGSDNATVRLDLENEPQPDALLQLEPLAGGRSQIDEDGYFQGPPELVVEIAASSASYGYDMNKKKRVYARNGVQEYVVFQTYERRVDWFVLRAHGYDALLPDAAGIVRSEIFSGLWLDSHAFWAGDMAKVLSTVQTGLASAEYATFVETIKNKLNPR